MTAYYHGGAPGLTVILPRQRTGASPRNFGGHRFERFIYSQERVWVTTSETLGAFYAAMQAHVAGKPEGTLYEVEPGADLDLDEAYWMGEGTIRLCCYACDSARVRRVVRTVPAGDATRLLHEACWDLAARPDRPPLTGEETAAFARRTLERAGRNGASPADLLAIGRAASRAAAARSIGAGLWGQPMAGQVMKAVLGR